MSNLPPQAETDRLLTQTEAAAYLSVKESTLESWRSPARRQPLPFLKLGRLVRYRKADLDAFISAQLHVGQGEV